MDCVFCSIVRGEIPTKKIYEDDITIAVLDIAPRSKASCIVFPKKHYDSPEKEEETSKKVFEVAMRISSTIKKLFNPVFVSICYLPSQSNHFHLKILPYYKDEIPLRESEPKRVDDVELEKIKTLISNSLKELPTEKKESTKKAINEVELSEDEVRIIKREIELP